MSLLKFTALRIFFLFKRFSVITLSFKSMLMMVGYPQMQFLSTVEPPLAEWSGLEIEYFRSWVQLQPRGLVLCTGVSVASSQQPSHSRSYIRESDRISFILTTPGISLAATFSGSLSFHSLFRSDHRTNYQDFGAIALFSATTLRLTYPMLIHQYRGLLHEKLKAHKCNTCEKSFGFRTHLQRHNNTVHKI